MIKSIKIFTLFVAISIVFASCLGDDDEPVVRTPQMEQEEINKAISTLENEGYDVDTTELGIFYMVNETGEGQTAQFGDTCYLEYSGFFLDGTLFDTSHNYDEEGISEVIFEKNKYITGYEDGIKLLNKGAQIDLIIPSAYGYGSNGNQVIPPYTPLYFALKMHDLKPKISEPTN